MIFIKQLLSFIEEAKIDTCDTSTKVALNEAITDLFASIIAGTEAPVSDIVKKFSQSQFGKGDCSVFISENQMTPAGATFVNATMANALDVDDGHRLTKGHPGAVVLPAILAAAEDQNTSGEDFLDAMIVGYEVAIRAGILSHKLRPEYHSTGSWGAVGAAAGVAKLLNSSSQVIEHALGIAEHQSTYSPMMRCIAEPSMLKDGIGWGSMVGLSSAYLAEEGFTGISSLFAFDNTKEVISDIGHHFKVNELYYKPYTSCRWAHPLIEAMKNIQQYQKIQVDQLDSITVHTFTESSQLMKEYPKNTEEAQYNLYFSLASYLVFGKVSPNEILRELENKKIQSLMDLMIVRVDPEIDDQFPSKALSRLEIKFKNGKVLNSDTVQARGDYDFPLSSEEKKSKFHQLTIPVIGEKQSQNIYDQLQNLSNIDNIRNFTSLIRN